MIMFNKSVLDMEPTLTQSSQTRFGGLGAFFGFGFFGGLGVFLFVWFCLFACGGFFWLLLL